jgi:hypothetical protein
MDETQKEKERENAEQFEDAVPVYADNVRVEMTPWDLRVFFGQLAPSGARKIDWHTDVSIPWVQAQLMHFFLGINIMMYERDNGRISIPKSVLPLLSEPPFGLSTSDPDAIEIFEIVQKMVREFREKGWRPQVTGPSHLNPPAESIPGPCASGQPPN